MVAADGGCKRTGGRGRRRKENEANEEKRTRRERTDPDTDSQPNATHKMWRFHQPQFPRFPLLIIAGLG